MSNLKKFLKTTDKIANILSEYNIKTPQDFFYYFPKSYEDRTQIKTIDQLVPDQKQTLKVRPTNMSVINTAKWKKLIEFKIEDEKWNIAYMDFINSPYAVKQVKMKKFIIISWKPKFSYWKWVFWFPEIITDTEKQQNWQAEFVWRIIPIYSEMLWIKSNWFAKKIFERLDQIPIYFQEFLPDYILKKYKLIWIQQAIKNIHFPESMSMLYKAKNRLNFEKLFVWQLISNYNKYLSEKQKNNPTDPDREIIKQFIYKLPFQLTKAQKKAIKTIVDDFHSGESMLRLLQWDVWSWKTVVALATAYYIIKKFEQQVAFMVPTEVLANQHFAGIWKMFLPLGLKPALLTWSTTAKQKKQIKQELADWKIDIIIWTHALIQEDVAFKNLWYVIIDEQHKFWVQQRAKLKAHWNPHILQMTATPIPRSLALSYFGEFENTIIDELPPWRSPVYTKVIREDEYIKLKWFFLNKIQQWEQIYIVTPLIEESDKLDEVKSSMEEYDAVKDLFPELAPWQIGLLHWKMRPKEKDEVMNKFKDWKIKILVSTTVIEVWVDVPKATIMVILNAERFGLSQLHQLRWRVWRSSLKSYCFLVSKARWGDTYRRLKAMEKYTDWFKLAEIDLEMRGAGTILGTKQSWEMDIPDETLKDIKLLEITRAEARNLLKKDPTLSNYPELKQIMKTYMKGEDILV